MSIVNSGRRVGPGEAGFNECRILAPKVDAKTGTESFGWFVPMLDNRLFCEMEVQKLVGDELTVCLGQPNGTRPRDFSAEPGSGRMLIKFRRPVGAK